MIPVSLRLEGFLSYKKMETPIRFDGARLWMLSGPNGAGKSTIFDAITFALYGIHRAGKQMKERLINKRSDSLLVEFEFLANGRRYRIKRTRTKEPKSTCEAREWVNGKWGSVISQTDDERRLQEWVQSPEVIGMDEGGFLASVLLRQGEADKLLKSLPSKRREYLSQILDLTAYQRLHQSAATRERDHDRDEKRLAGRLAILPLVSKEDVEQSKQVEQAAENVHQWHEQQVERLIVVLEQAKRWNALLTEKTKLENALQAAEELRQNQHEIEANATRYESLEQGLPLLDALYQSRQCWTTLQVELTRTQAEEQRCKEFKENVEKAEQETQDVRDQLDVQDRALMDKENRANAIIAELALAIAELDSRDLDQAELDKIIDGLLKFPQDLDEQIDQANQQVRSLEDAERALTPLIQYCRARQAWRQANTEKAEAEEEINQCNADVTVTQRELEEAKHAAANSEQAVAIQRQWETSEKIRLEDAEGRRNRFAETKDQAQCLFCGQDLLPEHRKKHEKLLTDNIASAQRAYEAAMQAVEKAAAAAHEHQEWAALRERALGERKKALEDAETLLRNAEDKGRRAQETAELALENLSWGYESRIRPSKEIPINECFITTYPTKEQYQELQTLTVGLPTKRQYVQEFERQRQERVNLMREHERLYTRLQASRQHLPDQSPGNMRRKFTDAKISSDEATEDRKALKQVYIAASKNLKEAIQRTNLARNQWDDAKKVVEKKRDETQRQEIEVARCEGALPDEWQQTKQQLTEARLEELRLEKLNLSGAAQKCNMLQEAIKSETLNRAELAKGKEEMNQIPQEAQQPVEQVEGEVAQARQDKEDAKEKCTAARLSRETRERERKDREKLEQEREEAAYKARLHGRLTKLLDNETGLQHTLVVRAMDGIVQNANRVLDRVSGGEMSIQLQEDDKNLELMINKAGQTGDPYDAWFLSGGEQFRVALSLALGIGQYASLTGQRTPSVIIDEGFGCLDETGRHDVIEALDEIQDELEKIIVVSHQQEFYDRFTNRYIITKDEEGCSQVRLA